MKRAAQYFALAAALTLVGCSGEQSALSPQGPAADTIARLTWILLGMAAAVFVIVIAATALAIAGPSSARRLLAGPRTVIAGGIVFPAVVLSALLAYGLWLMRADASADGAPVTVEVSGEQWWWRVTYRLPDGRSFESANEIRLPVGQTVALALTSPDVIHSLWIPSLAGKMDMIPGRTTTLRLKADRSGIYRGACAEYCGGPHALMALHAVVLPQQDFSVWMDSRLNRPAQPQETQGSRLFVAAGCGGCHAVDGTEARGTIGPNLTDLGSRQSLGAGLLPMSGENAARFIRHSQRLKPNNRMPSFEIFSDGELAALSSYLVTLK